MRGLRLVLNAACALGVMLAAFEILGARRRAFSGRQGRGPGLERLDARRTGGARREAAKGADGACVPAGLPAVKCRGSRGCRFASEAGRAAVYEEGQCQGTFRRREGPAELSRPARSAFTPTGALPEASRCRWTPGEASYAASRNRNWGHPSLVRDIGRFAQDAKEKDGWPGLLVGDLSMPRGGPMPFGHASHQDGLDVYIGNKPTPDRAAFRRGAGEHKNGKLSARPGDANPEVWKPNMRSLRRAGSYPEAARVFVNPAIKKWLCDNTRGDRGFLVG